MSDGGELEVLLARARALAAPRTEAWGGPASADVLVFHVRRALYAVAAELVLGVRKLARISPVPRGVGLAGLAVVDGEIVSVLRLDSVGPAFAAGEGASPALAVVLGRARPELALVADDIVGMRSATADRQGDAEGVVLLDGVALLRARVR